MRTLIPICAVLMCYSCGSGPQPAVEHPKQGMNSPIIISDGSVMIDVTDSSSYQPGADTTHASINKAGHLTKALGYQCDPAKGNCKAGSDCKKSVAAYCTLNVDPTSSFAIKASDGGTMSATLTWNTGTKGFDLVFTNAYGIQSDGAGGVDLIASPNSIQSVTVSGTTFACRGIKPCVTIDF